MQNDSFAFQTHTNKTACIGKLCLFCVINYVNVVFGSGNDKQWASHTLYNTLATDEKRQQKVVW